MEGTDGMKRLRHPDDYEPRIGICDHLMDPLATMKSECSKRIRLLESDPNTTVSDIVECALKQLKEIESFARENPRVEDVPEVPTKEIVEQPICIACMEKPKTWMTACCNHLVYCDDCVVRRDTPSYRQGGICDFRCTEFKGMVNGSGNQWLDLSKPFGGIKLHYKVHFGIHPGSTYRVPANSGYN